MIATKKTTLPRYICLLATVSSFLVALYDLLSKGVTGDEGRDRLLSFFLSPVIIVCVLLMLMLTLCYRSTKTRTLLCAVTALLAIDALRGGANLALTIGNAWGYHWRHGELALRQNAFLIYDLTATFAAVLLLVALARLVRGSGKRVLPITASIFYFMIGVAELLSRAIVQDVTRTWDSAVGVLPRMLLGAATVLYFLGNQPTTLSPLPGKNNKSVGCTKGRIARALCLLLTFLSIGATLYSLYLQRDLAGAPAHELHLALSFLLSYKTAAWVLFVLTLTVCYRCRPVKRALLAVILTLIAADGPLTLAIESFLDVCRHGWECRFAPRFLLASLSFAAALLLLVAFLGVALGKGKRSVGIMISVLYVFQGLIHIESLNEIYRWSYLTVEYVSMLLYGVALILYFVWEEREKPVFSSCRN